MRFTLNGTVAIKQPTASKIDAQIKNGFAFNGNRTNLVMAEVVLSYSDSGLSLHPGDKVMLRGDAAWQPWAKATFVLGEDEFVLCPVSALVGFESSNRLPGEEE